MLILFVHVYSIEKAVSLYYNNMQLAQIIVAQIIVTQMTAAQMILAYMNMA